MKPPLLRNERGIALLVVMGTITLLTYLMIDFTFESHVNKLRVHNLTDKAQARLTAEAGLRLAIARIKLYQEARNMIEKNENLKQMIDLSLLEESTRSPDLILPVPIVENMMNMQVRSTVERFNENLLLQGNLSLQIRTVSGFLNPNNLRATPLSEEERRQRDSRFTNPDEEQRSPQEVIEETLIETLSEAIERKSEEDDLFDIRYGNLDARLLIKELKYFVNHPDDFRDSERAEIEAMYLGRGVRAKHAPLTSLEELYLLEGWDDAIVDLIKDRLTVHEVSVIQVNELTANQLRIMFPEISDFQIEEFFLYRDGDPSRDERPRPFRNAEDFKDVIVNRLAVIHDEQFDEMIQSFEAAGLTIGVAGKLFQVISSATVERSTYSILAFIDLPIKPEPPPPPKEEEDPDRSRREEDPDDFDDRDDSRDRDENEEDKKEKPLELLTPRAVEIRRI